MKIRFWQWIPLIAFIVAVVLRIAVPLGMTASQNQQNNKSR